MIWRILTGPIEEISGEIPRRRVQGGEGFKFIDHLVIEILNNRAQQLFQFIEVEKQSGLIQLFAEESDEYPVVMGVRVLTPVRSSFGK